MIRIRGSEPIHLEISPGSSTPRPNVEVLDGLVNVAWLLVRRSTEGKSSLSLRSMPCDSGVLVIGNAVDDAIAVHEVFSSLRCRGCPKRVTFQRETKNPPPAAWLSLPIRIGPSTSTAKFTLGYPVCQVDLSLVERLEQGNRVKES